MKTSLHLLFFQFELTYCFMFFAHVTSFSFLETTNTLWNVYIVSLLSLCVREVGDRLSKKLYIPTIMLCWTKCKFIGGLVKRRGTGLTQKFFHTKWNEDVWKFIQIQKSDGSDPTIFMLDKKETAILSDANLKRDSEAFIPLNWAILDLWLTWMKKEHYCTNKFHVRFNSDAYINILSLF